MNTEQKINADPSLVEWMARIRKLIVYGDLLPVPHANDEIVIRISSPEEAEKLFRAASIHLSLNTHIYNTFKITVRLSFKEDYFVIDWPLMKEIAVVNNELVSNILGTRKVDKFIVDIE